MQTLIQCENLSMIYKNSSGQEKTAVKNVSLSIYKGETFGLVGESGCGKTTLGYMMLDLIKPVSGRVFFKNNDIEKFNGAQKKNFHKDCQIIFQDPYASIDGKRKIAFLIREGLDIHHIGKTMAERDALVDAVMKSVGLDCAIKKRTPQTLSGGQRQRIAIAQALVLNPQFIVCDEPVSALDVLIQAQVLNLLKDLQKQYSLTYLFISHNLNVVSYMADRIAVMYKGEIVETGRTEQIIKNPVHPYTKELFKAANLASLKQ